jgi:O-phosphoseryl-tRNA(Cys) synthetase
LKRGLNKVKAELGSKDSLYAYALHKLGRRYLEMGEYALAEPLLVEAKTVYQQVFGNSHPKYARILITLGQLYQREGIFALAEPLFIESKKI